ncbi:MAG TPA: 6-bladed beta-propeller, partial [Proteobacteria bacterium]|nr:6-bladed beta-propeller [Pseudomonadota bacterium]
MEVREIVRDKVKVKKKTTVVLILLMAFFPITVFATIVEPGDTGSIIFPVKNAVESVGNMEGVEIEVNAPSIFIVKGTSLLGPQTISPNNSYSFKVYYKISSSAPPGIFEVKLKIKPTTPNCIPKPPDTSWEVIIPFEVVSFKVTVNPPTMSIEQGETGTHTITIENKYIEPENFSINIDPDGTPDWMVSQASQSNITVGAGGVGEVTFEVTNNGAAENISILIEVTATTWGITKTPENLAASANGHIQDHPDDTSDISDPSYPTVWKYDSKSNIGILFTGWGEGLGHLLGRYDVATCIVKSDLTILNEPGRSMDDLRILLIGSAGLVGFESSETFKQKLADYVNNGGTLIVFTQQHGYEFSALPVPEGDTLSGFGWSEDQACSRKAVYIDTDHVMFSGQTSAILDVNVDGYFSRWPENATVLLRRTKNSLPAMLEYDYGQGKVVVSTLYSDWTYGHQQLTRAEHSLVRDLISWAKDPDKEIPEYEPGDLVDGELLAINSQMNTQTAATVRIDIIEPDRDILDVQEIPLSLAPGESTTVLFDYQSPVTDCPLGIWWADYSLLNDIGDAIQPRMEGERFAVRQDIVVGGYNLGDFQIWATTPSEEVARGSMVTYTIYIINNTDQDFEDGNIGIFAHEDGGDWWRYEGVIHDIAIPAHSQASYSYSTQLNYSTSMYFYLFPPGADYTDNTHGSILSCQKGIWVFTPTVGIEVQAERELYEPGEEVAISLDLQNLQNADYTGDVMVRITDPDNLKVLEETLTVFLPAEGSSSESLVYTIPIIPKRGIYSIHAEAYYDGETIGSGFGHFEVPEVVLKLTPSIPELFEPSTPISFQIDNSGLAEASGGTLLITLSHPDSGVIWTDNVDFGLLLPGESVAFDFIVSTGDLKFGIYKLTYTLSYDEKTIDGKVDIPCGSSIKIDLDKNSYRVREDVSLTVKLTNTGKFEQDLTVITEVPDCTFTDIRNVVLNPGESEIIPHLVTIPETIDPGKHELDVTVSLSPGNQIQNSSSFIVPQSNIALTLDDLEYSAGENVSVQLENTGGVDTIFNYTIELIDSFSEQINSDSGADPILAAGMGTIDIAVPEEATPGKYLLKITGHDIEANKDILWQKYLNVVGGLEASLDLYTDKEVYRNTEDIIVAADIVNQDVEINNADLQMRIVRTGSMVYVCDTDNNRIQVFDAEGNYRLEFGGSGSGDGQFSQPYDLCVDDINNIYVTDRGNNRVEKFDSQGNYITQWGGSGTDSTNFDQPMGIATAGDFVYVCDSGNYAVKKFDPIGNFVDSFNLEYTPYEIEVDPYGELIVITRVNSDVGAKGGTGMSYGGLTIDNPKSTASTVKSIENTTSSNGVLEEELKSVVEDYRQNQDRDQFRARVEEYKQKIKEEAMQRVGSTINRSTQSGGDDSNGASISTERASVRRQSGSTINVPGDYTTIQAAIDAAVVGDTIVVEAGTYYEALDIKSGITLLGSGADSTIIDAGGSAVINEVEPISDFTIDGFAIRNIGCIYFYEYAERITISNIRFEYGGVAESYPTGVHFLREAEEIEISNNRILSGNPAAGVDGIHFWAPANHITISSNILSNLPGGIGGIHLWEEVNDVEVTDNELSVMDGYDNGIFFWDLSNTVKVSGNNISHMSSYYSGIYFWEAVDTAEISFNELRDFEPGYSNDSNGIYFWDAQHNLDIFHNLVAKVSHDPGAWNIGIMFSGYFYQDGIRIGSENVAVYNNTIADNQGSGIMALYVQYPCLNVTIANNIIANNSGTGWASGGLGYFGFNYGPPEYEPVLSHNNAWNNTVDNYFGIEPGEEDISVDPLFNGAGDYRLAYGSPCIGTGDPVFGVNIGAFGEGFASLLSKMDSDGNVADEYSDKELITDATGDEDFIYATGYSDDSAGSFIKRFDITDLSEPVDIWKRQGSGDGEFDEPRGICVDERNIYLSDSGNNRVQVLDKSTGTYISQFGSAGSAGGLFELPIGIETGSGEDIYWEGNASIALPPHDSYSLQTDIGTIDQTGKFFLTGILTSAMGQIIAKDTLPFFITDSDTSLTVNTDKLIYQPNETILITGEVRNNSGIAADNLNLVLTAGINEILNEVFSLDTGDIYPYTVTTSAIESFTLAAAVDDVTISDYIVISEPQLEVTATAPDVVGRESFIIDVLLENTGKVLLDLTLDIGGRVKQLDIPAGESGFAQETFTIIEDTAIEIIISGDVNRTISKTIVFGENIKITLSPEPVYPVGRVNIPYTVENTGQLDSEVEVDFTLIPQTGSPRQLTFHIPEGESVSRELFYELAGGEYILTYGSFFDEGSAAFRVADPNQVEIVAIKLLALDDGQIPFEVEVHNIGSNSFRGNLSLNTGFYKDEQTLDLEKNETKKVVFSVPPVAAAGEYLAVAEVFQDGSLLVEKSQPFTLAPEFAFPNLPSGLNVTVGEELTIPLTVKNIGNADGTGEISMTALDIFNETKSLWFEVGEEHEVSFTTLIPEDFPDGDYVAQVKAGETEAQIPFKVTGYLVDVNASLDKPFYVTGETATLTLEVMNRSELFSILYAAVIFNEYEEVQPFYLESEPKDIDIVSSPGDVILASETNIGTSRYDLEDGQIPPTFTTGGDQPWLITTRQPQNDIYSLDSNDNVGDNQTSWLEADLDCTDSGAISFSWMVKSEFDYDFAHFYIDNLEEYFASGDGSWQSFSRQMSEGPHTLKWTYVKDSSVSENEDAHFLDDLTFEGIRTSTFLSSGTFASSIYDAGTIVDWELISWSETLPAGTDISLETRSGDTPTPDKTWSEWSPVYTDSTGEAIVSPSSRYIQYRASLSTIDPFVTPTLHEVKIDSVSDSWSQSTQEDFTTGVQILEFSVPVTFTGSNKIFYGIYLGSGRSLYLNSIYIHEKQDIINLWTDKQVYRAGETVTVTVETTESGLLEISAPGYSDQRTLDIGETTFQFTLPEEMVSGSFTIDYIFEGESYSYPFNVMGYFARILECSLDKSEYCHDDLMEIAYRIDAGCDMDCLLRGWIKDAAGSYTDCFELSLSLIEGENLVMVTGSMLAAHSGMAQVVYGLYKPIEDDEYGLLLTAGTESFDALIDTIPPVTTISYDYNDGTTVIPESQFTLTATDYGDCSSGIVQIEYKIDEETDWTEYNEPFTLQTYAFGEHAIYYRGIDMVGNVEETRSEPVTISPALEVIKTISLRPRVLAWLNYKEKHGNLIGELPQVPINAVLIEQALEEAGVLSSHTVLSEDDFATEMRSNLYNVYLIFGRTKHLKKKPYGKELIERVNIGQGLITSLWKHIEDSPGSHNCHGIEVLGIKTKGHLSEKDCLVHLIDSPISGPGTYQTIGKTVRVEIPEESAAEMAGYVEESNPPGGIIYLTLEYTDTRTVEIEAYDKRTLIGTYSGTGPFIFTIDGSTLDEEKLGRKTIVEIYENDELIERERLHTSCSQTLIPGMTFGNLSIIEVGKAIFTSHAIVLNQYGLGKTVFYAFDLGQSVTDDSYNQFVGLLRNSLDYVKPSDDSIISGDVAAIDIAVKSPVVPSNLSINVTEIIPDAIAVLNTFEGQQSGQVINWNFDLIRNQSKVLSYVVKLPQVAATYSLISDISYQVRDIYRVFDSVNLHLIIEY